MTNWEKEKAYTAKRAAELGAAIEAFDRAKFEKAYQTSMRYMPKKQRSGYYKRFLVKYMEAAAM